MGLRACVFVAFLAAVAVWAADTDVKVAVVQLSADETDRMAAAKAAISQAATGGADLAVLPERWAAGLDSAQCTTQYGALAKELGIAIAATYGKTGETGIVLLDRTGVPLLTYSKPQDGPNEPVPGGQAAMEIAHLVTPHGTVRVGALLGTDIFWQVGFCGGTCGELAFHPKSAPAHLTSPPPCPANAKAGADPQTITFSFDVSTLPLYRRDYTIQADCARRPFDYQKMCYGSAPRASAPEPPPGAGPLKVKVALCQMRGVKNDTDPVGANMEKGEAFVRQAKAQGADVALFPEMFSVGYGANFPNYNTSHPDSSVLFHWMNLGTPANGRYVNRFRELARELDIAVAASFLEEAPEPTGARRPPRNSVAVIDRHGEILYVYSKVHTVIMASDEVLTTAGREWYTGVLNTAGGNVTVGSLICFDREHDESAHMSMLNGAELLLAPTACGLPEAIQEEMSVRAEENVLAWAMSNYPDNGYDHTGKALLVAPQQDEGLYVVEFDIGALREARKTARGRALITPPLRPAVCHLPKVADYRSTDATPGDDYLVRTNNAL